MATTKYDIDDKVYALDTYNAGNGITIPQSISICIIVSISIYEDGNIYYLKSYPSGDEWGDSVKEEHISKDINDLAKHLKL